MNEISFDVRHNGFIDLIVPNIDDKSLIETLKAIELPFARKEGFPEIAGSYAGLRFSDVEPLSKYYYGGSEREESTGKVLILQCDCLNYGCWEFLAEIEADGETIKWKDFQQL
jgi:hypothetical protein